MTQKFFQQIGALDEIMSHAKMITSMVTANEDRKVEYTLEFGEQVKLYDPHRLKSIYVILTLAMLPPCESRTHRALHATSLLLL
jgi:hypothetical protein